MADFLLLIRGGRRIENDGLTGVELEKQLKKWVYWMTSLESKGILKGGDPLNAEFRLVDSNGVVVDEALDSKEMVSGYLLLDVENMEEASKAAQGCPALSTGAKIEIRPVDENLPVLLDKMRQLVSVPMN